MGKPSNTVKIRELNDAFRQTFSGGRVMLTSGALALPEQGKMELLGKVKAFNGFNNADDPHAEHDFGSIETGSEKFFWKIDCYDLSLTSASDDPADPAKTLRVITIMRADVY